MQTSKESSGVDKQGLYGWWHYNQRWRENLNRKATHKALDIPEDDGMINSPRVTNVGMGWKELAVIGLVALGGVYGMLKIMEPAASPPAQPPTVQQPAPTGGPLDSEYEVRFFDADGNPINVPHISQRPGA